VAIVLSTLTLGKGEKEVRTEDEILKKNGKNRDVPNRS